jgi:hypothetical protein
MATTPRLHRARRRLAAGALALTCVMVAGACSGDGRTLRAPDPGVTAPRRVEPTTTVDPVEFQVLTLVSDDFTPGGVLPAIFTCDGEGLSPSLNWYWLEPDVVELGLVVTEQSDGSVLWVVGGIDPELGDGTDAGTLPTGAVEAQNGEGTVGWSAPCPPSGETRTYDFTLYALEAQSQIGEGMLSSDAISLLRATPGDTTVLTATFTSS